MEPWPQNPTDAIKILNQPTSGIKTAKITAKTGPIVSAVMVNSKALDEDIIIISSRGQVIRLPLKSISVLGRATQGVRLMKFKEADDRAASIALF